MNDPNHHENPCLVCGRTDEEKPMVYRKTPWCSGLHERSWKRTNPTEGWRPRS